MREELSREPLRQFFHGLVDEVVPASTGLDHRGILAYLADLLRRFAAVSEVYRLRDLEGERLAHVAELVREVEHGLGSFSDSFERDFRRHIGDLTLFWTGVFPEALPRLQALRSPDHALDYVREGRRAYLAVSRMEETSGDAERQRAVLFHRLALHFELCAAGLNAVRREWERRAEQDLSDLYGLE